MNNSFKPIRLIRYLLILIVILPAASFGASPVTETFDNGSLDGWLPNTSQTTVTIQNVGLGATDQKPATQESEQNMCSQTKTRLLDQIGTAEACAEKANKKGRANDAKNCWNAFPSKTDAMSERAQAEVIPESECPPTGPGGGSTGLKISCYHSGYLVWCCGGGRCCDSAYGGYGCWSQ